MSIDVHRRFYREAAAVPVAGGWSIALDGKIVKTPARSDLVIAGRGLAEAIAAEWSAQETRVKPDTMPLMQLTSTALDRVHPDRARIVAETVAFAATDLVCHRAAGPADLVARQTAVWDPLLDWLRERFDVTLNLAEGVIAVPQPEAALATLAGVVAGQDDFRLTALSVMTGAAGSLAIGLAVFEGRIGPEEGAVAAQLDELYQAERWGLDREAELRRAAQRGDIVHARRFLELLTAG